MKERLHQLVEALPEQERDKAARLLEALAGLGPDEPFYKADSAPLDDEPETDEERTAVAEGLADLAAGRVVTQSELTAQFGGGWHEDGMRIEVDDEELFPPASSLVGLEFVTDSDFQACQAILREDLERFRLLNQYARYAVVRKADVHLFAEAALDFSEQEFGESDNLSADDAYSLDRAMIDEWMPRFVDHLRRDG